MLIPRRTTTQKNQIAVRIIMNGVGRARRNRNRVARADTLRLPHEVHDPFAFENVVDLFGFRVVMRRRVDAGRDGGLGEALMADRGVAVREEFADRGTVFGDEGWAGIAVDHRAWVLGLGGDKTLA